MSPHFRDRQNRIVRSFAAKLPSVRLTDSSRMRNNGFLWSSRGRGLPSSGGSWCPGPRSWGASGWALCPSSGSLGSRWVLEGLGSEGAGSLRDSKGSVRKLSGTKTTPPLTGYASPLCTAHMMQKAEPPISSKGFFRVMTSHRMMLQLNTSHFSL